MTKHAQSIETLEPSELAKLLHAGKVLLIDVREPSEYASERIAGALLYPLSTFDATTLPPDGVRRVVFQNPRTRHSQPLSQEFLPSEMFALARSNASPHPSGKARS